MSGVRPLPPNQAPPPRQSDVSVDAEQAAAYFRIEGMRHAFAIIDEILADRAEAWAKESQRQSIFQATGRILATEVERVRELVSALMKATEGTRRGPTGSG